MKHILVGGLACIGALVVLLIIIALGLGGLAWTRQAQCQRRPSSK